MAEEEHKKTATIDLFARHVSSGKVDYFSQAGIDFVAGERQGIYLCDIDGKRLINCHSNGGVFNLGHRNPRIMRALQDALEEYDIGNHHLISFPTAAAITAITAAGLAMVVNPPVKTG
jgi:putrescine aminotransferase